MKKNEDVVLKQILEELKSELDDETQLLDDLQIKKQFREEFHSKLGSLVKNGYSVDWIARLVVELVSLRRGNEYAMELTNLTSKTKITEKQRSLLLLFSYLQLSEGVFAKCVELIAFVLLKNGYRLYKSKTQLVTTFEELEEKTVHSKLKFIKDNGFEEITNEYDKDLRNCIAHLKFVVNNDGSIKNCVNNEENTQDLLNVKYGILQGIVFMITNAFLRILVFKEYEPV